MGSALLALLSSTHLSELANCSQGPGGGCPPGGPLPDCNTYPCLIGRAADNLGTIGTAVLGLGGLAISKKCLDKYEELQEKKMDRLANMKNFTSLEESYSILGMEYKYKIDCSGMKGSAESDDQSYMDQIMDSEDTEQASVGKK